MFSMMKSGEILTRRYEVSPARRIALVAAGIAGLGLGVFSMVDTSSARVSPLAILLPVFFCVALMAYWVISDAATTAVFDLAERRLTVHRERPLFGPPRAFSFDEVAALCAVNRSGEAVDSWEARIELHDGARLRLGRESEGPHERIREHLAEIRRATGIGGASLALTKGSRSGLLANLPLRIGEIIGSVENFGLRFR